MPLNPSSIEMIFLAKLVLAILLEAAAAPSTTAWPALVLTAAAATLVAPAAAAPPSLTADLPNSLPIGPSTVVNADTIRIPNPVSVENPLVSNPATLVTPLLIAPIAVVAIPSIGPNQPLSLLKKLLSFLSSFLPVTLSLTALPVDLSLFHQLFLLAGLSGSSSP